MRLPRKIKKNLRCILLCYTGNPAVKKAKYGKKQWSVLKKKVSNMA